MSDTTSPWGQPIVQTASPAAAPAEPDLAPSRPLYDGRLGDLYAIYLRHVVLMVLTLGWSRFWGRTRLRRYLWNHFAVLGDRFEYRGRGRELLIGFLLALLMLATWAGLMWLLWVYVFHEKPFASFGLFDIFSLSVALIGFPLAYVGHYAGLRYKFSRTRWRGIRCGMAGSAWGYGAMATFLTFANAFTGYLLTPVVSVNLARPRISNVRFGTLPFVFAGSAGDIYGRYLGFYFLNIIAWLVAAAIIFAAIGGTVDSLGISSDDVAEAVLAAQHAHHPDHRRRRARRLHRVRPVDPAAALLVAGLPVPLPGLAFSRAGNVLFATAISTRQMWGFLVLNYLIVVLTLGLGWPWVIHRTLKLIAAELWLYGAPDGAAIRQPPDRGPRFGEGLLDMFDVSGI